MTAAELRSRIARSGFSGKRLANALGIAQPQVAKWCAGVRSIPEHHVPMIIKLTDDPPPRTVPVWRPPVDMPPVMPAAPPRKRIADRAVRGSSQSQIRSRSQESSEPTGTDWTGLIHALNRLLEAAGSNSVAPVPVIEPSPVPVLTAPEPQWGRSGRETRARTVAKPAPPVSVVSVTAATGPLHTDFVNQHNAAQQRRQR